MDVEKTLEEMKKSVFVEYQKLTKEYPDEMIEHKLYLALNAIDEKFSEFYKLLEYLCK